MHVCLLCMYSHIFIYTYVDLLATMFLFYQFISSFLQRIQSLNTNGFLHSLSLSLSLCSKHFSEKGGVSKAEISLRNLLF